MVIFREELEDFAHAVRGGRAYEVTVEQAIRVVAVCEAVVRSVETGRLVNVSDFLKESDYSRSRSSLPPCGTGPMHWSVSK